MPTKELIRRELIKRRKALSERERAELSERVRGLLLSLPELKSASVVALFYPVAGEPDLLPLFELLKDKLLLLPRVEGDELVLARAEGLKKGAFGIPEPAGEPFPAEKVELFLVPGVAFDEEGYRLGFGKGFYDRLLRGKKGFKVGVGYEFQVLKRLPRSPWDQRLDALVTEKRVRRFNHGRS
ncbi:MAG: 5-formyltetrahydrofolate cyclo-ligase [Aquificae bacterium]|nr:5-formyltetrahydrofolate cyclo-ligase [Aquificota bacterium]